MTKKVKEFTIYKNDYTVDDFQSDSLKVRGYKYSSTEYDSMGNTVREVKYSFDGIAEEGIERKYDDASRLVEEVYIAEGEVAERKSYNYNEKGFIEQEIKHYLDGSADTILYFYDEEDRLTGKELRDSDGVVEFSQKYEHKGDKLVTERHYDEAERLTSEKTFSYDEQGRLVESTEWNDEEDRLMRNVVEFDDQGKQIGTLFYIDNKLRGKTILTYNDKSHVEKITEETPGEIHFVYLHYDGNGNVIRQEEYNQHEELLNRVERKFDEQNQVTESHVFIDGQGRSMSQKYFLRYEYVYFE